MTWMFSTAQTAWRMPIRLNRMSRLIRIEQFRSNSFSFRYVVAENLTAGYFQNGNSSGYCRESQERSWNMEKHSLATPSQLYPTLSIP